MPPRTTCLDKRDVRHPRLVVVLWRERPSQTLQSASCFGTTPRRLPRQGGTHTSLDKRDVRHPRASAHPSSSTAAGGSNGEMMDRNQPRNGTSGTIGVQSIDVHAEGSVAAAHVGQRATRWKYSIRQDTNGQTRCTAPSSTSCPNAMGQRNRHRASAHPSSSASPGRRSDIVTLVLLCRDVRHHRRLCCAVA